MLISWSKKFETGIEAIDRQHKNLFAIIERLYEAKKGDGKNLGLRIASVAEELIEYAEIHFKTEESLMEKSHYEGLKEHKRVHNKFQEAAKTYGVRIKAQSGDVFLAMEMMNFLIDWLIEHVSVTDMEYVSCVKASCPK
jgi:hemerythrin